MTASDENDEEMEIVTPDLLPPDSIQETISKQWLNTLKSASPGVPAGVPTAAGKDAASLSSRLETGAFLQQLTNSVGRALHKQNCTCSGRAYTGDELRSLGHPAMFAPPTAGGSPAAGQQPGGGRGSTVSLPPIDGDGLSPARAPLLDGGPLLRARSDRDGGHHHQQRPVGAPRRGAAAAAAAKPLGSALASERKEREELKLPNIMDIVDGSGNSWRIVQEVARRRHQQPTRTARYDTKLFDGKGAQLYECRSPPKTPSGAASAVRHGPGPASEMDHRSHRGEPTEAGDDNAAEAAADAAIDAVTRSNSPRSPALDAAAADGLRNPPQAGRLLPELAPSCTLVQIHQSPRPSADSIPADCSLDEAERRALLLRLNSAVRTGKMPYLEFLRKVSRLAPSLRLEAGRDKRARTSSMELAVQDEGVKRQDTGHHRVDRDTWTQAEPNAAAAATNTDAPTLASSSYTGIYARDAHPANAATLPPELQNLYSRGGLKVTTLRIDVGEALPDNFLTKEREDLQVLYPMYGSRVEHERDTAAARLNSLQAKGGEKAPTTAEPPREQRAQAGEVGVLLLPTGQAGPMTSDPGDFKLKFKVRKEADGPSREGRLYCLQGRQSLSREGEILELPPESYVRRLGAGGVWDGRDGLCPSRAFPRQPPTTPADDRGVKSQATASELVARSIPSTIPETCDTADAAKGGQQQAADHRSKAASSSRTLGRIAEDPLDRVSHANTYGTEQEPTRLTESFHETPGRREEEEEKEEEEERMVREYVHVVVPTTSGRAAGKGKRVSWQQQQQDDSTTDFTRSRETLQSVQTGDRPATPDRAQLAFTISDASMSVGAPGPACAGRAAEGIRRPAVQVLEMDGSSSVGTFESLSRRYEAGSGLHGIPEGGHALPGDGGRKHARVSVSTQKVVFVSPARDQKKSEDA